MRFVELKCGLEKKFVYENSNVDLYTRNSIHFIILIRRFPVNEL